MGSTPSLQEFDPQVIPSQFAALKLVRKLYDFNNGVLEIMLSGSFGSAKSILMAHLAVTHCMMYPQARILLGRKSFPDLKQTILAKLLEHMYGDLHEGKHYVYNRGNHIITFANGSEIICRSWHDKNFKKFRSLELSAAIIEELTENGDDHKDFYGELIARIGRLVHIPESFCICATNPDGPEHWAYEYFIEGAKKYKNRFTLYSKTSDNPFLPKWYIPSLREKYSPRLCRRLIDGEWLAIDSDYIYNEYKEEKHYILSNTQPDKQYPIDLSFDFNIGEGKPMSAVLAQYKVDRKHYTFIDEFVVKGARTKDIMDEIASKGWLDLPHNPIIRIFGDSAGKHKDTRSNNSDYDIIKKFLSNYERKDKQDIEFEMQVPKSNPPIRDRHNKVNGQLCNGLGHVNISIDKRCETVNTGLKKTKLKSGGSYIEDDSKEYQHITTALGYYICRQLRLLDVKEVRYGTY